MWKKRNLGQPEVPASYYLSLSNNELYYEYFTGDTLPQIKDRPHKKQEKVTTPSIPQKSVDDTVQNTHIDERVMELLRAVPYTYQYITNNLYKGTDVKPKFDPELGQNFLKFYISVLNPDQRILINEYILNGPDSVNGPMPMSLRAFDVVNHYDDLQDKFESTVRALHKDYLNGPIIQAYYKQHVDKPGVEKQDIIH